VARATPERRRESPLRKERTRVSVTRHARYPSGRTINLVIIIYNNIIIIAVLYIEGDHLSDSAFPAGHTKAASVADERCPLHHHRERTFFAIETRTRRIDDRDELFCDIEGKAGSNGRA